MGAFPLGLHPAAPAERGADERPRRAASRRLARSETAPASPRWSAAPAGGIEPPTTRLTGGRSPLSCRNMEAQRLHFTAHPGLSQIRCAPDAGAAGSRGQVDRRGIEHSNRPLKRRLLYPAELQGPRGGHTSAWPVTRSASQTTSTIPRARLPGAVNAPRQPRSRIEMLPTAFSAAPPFLRAQLPPRQRRRRARAQRQLISSTRRQPGDPQQADSPQPDRKPTGRPTAHGRSPAHKRADSRSEADSPQAPERRRPHRFPEAAFAGASSIDACLLPLGAILRVTELPRRTEAARVALDYAPNVHRHRAGDPMPWPHRAFPTWTGW